MIKIGAILYIHRKSLTKPHAVIPQESDTRGEGTDPFRMTACGVDVILLCTLTYILSFRRNLTRGEKGQILSG